MDKDGKGELEDDKRRIERWLQEQCGFGSMGLGGYRNSDYLEGVGGGRADSPLLGYAFPTATDAPEPDSPPPVGYPSDVPSLSKSVSSIPSSPSSFTPSGPLTMNPEVGRAVAPQQNTRNRHSFNNKMRSPTTWGSARSLSPTPSVRDAVFFDPQRGMPKSPSRSQSHQHLAQQPIEKRPFQQEATYQYPPHRQPIPASPINFAPPPKRLIGPPSMPPCPRHVRNLAIVSVNPHLDLEPKPEPEPLEAQDDDSSVVVDADGVYHHHHHHHYHHHHHPSPASTIVPKKSSLSLASDYSAPRNYGSPVDGSFPTFPERPSHPPPPSPNAKRKTWIRGFRVPPSAVVDATANLDHTLDFWDAGETWVNREDYEEEDHEDRDEYHVELPYAYNPAPIDVEQHHSERWRQKGKEEEKKRGPLSSFISRISHSASSPSTPGLVVSPASEKSPPSTSIPNTPTPNTNTPLFSRPLLSIPLLNTPLLTSTSVSPVASMFPSTNANTNANTNASAKKKKKPPRATFASAFESSVCRI